MSSPLHSVNSHDASVTAAERLVLHHGDVQLAGGMFRKKSQYLVLTDNHLIRFKSRSKAADVFPSIPASKGRRNDEARHSRLSSSGSIHELQTTSANDAFAAMPLNEIVAVYKLDDGRPYFSVEVAHLDQDRPSAITLRKCNIDCNLVLPPSIILRPYGFRLTISMVRVIIQSLSCSA